MAAWDGINRRKFPRVEYPCLVIIRHNQNEQDVLLTHTENLGIGGICITLKKNVKLFAPVEVEIDMLDLGTHIKCEGKVVWSFHRRSDERKKPLFYDTGVEFINLNSKDQKRIEEIVMRLAKQLD